MRKPKRQPKPVPAKREAFHIERLFPKTEAQRSMVEAYQVEGLNVVAFGSAGTGKTYVACYLALADLMNRDKDKIVIIRSAVPTRDQGFLPGTLEEKSAVYQTPYVGIVNDICQNGAAWEIMRKKEQIQFMTTSYVRGITLDNAVLIIDEFQNMNKEELYSVLTRVGENTQVIICGDTKQTDLRKETSAFAWLDKITTRMDDWFETVCFTSQDIVRSGFVRDLIMTEEGLRP